MKWSSLAGVLCALMPSRVGSIVVIEHMLKDQSTKAKKMIQGVLHVGRHPVDATQEANVVPVALLKQGQLGEQEVDNMHVALKERLLQAKKEKISDVVHKHTLPSPKVNDVLALSSSKKSNAVQDPIANLRSPTEENLQGVGRVVDASTMLESMKMTYARADAGTLRAQIRKADDTTHWFLIHCTWGFFKTAASLMWVLLKKAAWFAVKVVARLFIVAVWSIGGFAAGAAACFVTARQDRNENQVLEDAEGASAGDNILDVLTRWLDKYVLRQWCSKHANHANAHSFAYALLAACAILSALASLSMEGVIRFVQVNVGLFVIAMGFIGLYRFPDK